MRPVGAVALTPSSAIWSRCLPATPGRLISLRACRSGLRSQLPRAPLMTMYHSSVSAAESTASSPTTPLGVAAVLHCQIQTRTGAYDGAGSAFTQEPSLLKSRTVKKVPTHALMRITAVSALEIGRHRDA